MLPLFIAKLMSKPIYGKWDYRCNSLFILADQAQFEYHRALEWGYSYKVLYYADMCIFHIYSLGFCQIFTFIVGFICLIVFCPLSTYPFLSVFVFVSVLASVCTHVFVLTVFTTSCPLCVAACTHSTHQANWPEQRECTSSSVSDIGNWLTTKRSEEEKKM